MNAEQIIENPITTTIIISSPPFSDISGKEGLDLALVCAAFEQRVNLIYVDRGIFHLVKNQNPEAIEDKYHDKQLSALSFYDIDSIYYDESALTDLGMAESELIESSSSLTRSQINKMICESDHTLNF